MEVIQEVKVLVSNEEIYIGTSDVPDLKTFHISDRHTDVTTYDFSEIWVIILDQTTRIINNIMQKFLYRNVILLYMRYCMEIVFTINTLQGQCLCDMMNRRCKSIYGNHYAQVFPKTPIMIIFPGGFQEQLCRYLKYVL